jgi:hypothetical protein
VLSLLAILLAAGDGFEGCGELDGVGIASRRVDGSPFVEYRFTLETTGEVEQLCARAYGTGALQPGEPHVRLRTVLQELADERLTYEQVAPPVVSARDVVLRTRRSTGPGLCRVEFRSTDDAPLREGYVRMKHLEGSYLFEKRPGGRVHVEHRIHVDLGGSLSPFLVEGSRRTVGVDWLLRLVGLRR